MRTFSIPYALALFACSVFGGTSVITTRLDDPKAVYLAAPAFAVHADGKTDDSAAIQAAIDQADVNHEGIVFIPPGRYAIARTVYVRSGIRLFGYGATRPTFVLPESTAGFQKGMGVMFMFIGWRPGGAYDPGTRVPVPPPGTVPPKEVPDANSGTFYSSMSNIDFEICDGNPAAVGIRFHVAQHAFLTTWTSDRLGPRRRSSGRQRGRRSSFLRRPLRHPDGEDFARLAVYAHRLEF